jgi:hypothetical protein
MESVSSSIAKAWARGRSGYRRVLQSPGSESRGDDESSGRVDKAHFDPASIAYPAVQDSGEGTPTDSAPRRVARVLRRDLLEDELRMFSQI